MNERVSLRRTFQWGLVAAIGFSVGIAYRYFIDNASESDLFNYLRSGLHGAGIGLAAWAVQNMAGPHGRHWLGRRLRALPLLGELVVRSVIMTLVIVITGVALQFLLYAEPYRLQWFKFDWFAGTLPWIIGLGLAVSFIIGVLTEAARIIGGPMLTSIVLGTYHRPRREQLIVMFLDMADSTRLAEAMGELQVHNLITRFFFDVEGPITDCGGTIHSYVGDELIVTWPLLEEPASNARCLRSFAAVERSISELDSSYRREFGIVPRFRAAVHSGPVIVSECGSSKRQLAFFGDTMNVTARLCEYCKEAGHRLVASADLLMRLTVPPDLAVGDLEIVSLRGRREPMKLRAVRGSGDASRDAIELA